MNDVHLGKEGSCRWRQSESATPLCHCSATVVHADTASGIGRRSGLRPCSRSRIRRASTRLLFQQRRARCPGQFHSRAALSEGGGRAEWVRLRPATLIGESARHNERTVEGGPPGSGTAGSRDHGNSPPSRGWRTAPRVPHATNWRWAGLSAFGINDLQRPCNRAQRRKIRSRFQRSAELCRSCAPVMATTTERHCRAVDCDARDASG
jgi:hypothetical protein